MFITGMGMRKVKGLLARASKDLALAKRYKQIREYTIATFLYNKAIEKVLRALFITRTKKDPPSNVSIEYLANSARIPEDITTDLDRKSVV